MAIGIAGILFATRALEMTGDSLSYARAARSGEDLYHPHHLVFTAAVRGIYLLLAWFTGLRDVLLAAQLHNLAFLTLGLLAVFWIGWRRLGSAAVGIVGVLLWAATAETMAYATQVEVYVPAIACLAAATAVLLEDRWGRSRLILLAALWTLAVLYHQTAVLWAVPLLVHFLRRGRLRRGLLVAGGAGGATLAAYLAAYLAENRGGRGFLEYCLFYVEHGPETWGTVSNLGWDGLHLLLETQWRALSALPATGFVVAALVAALLALATFAFRGWRSPSPPADLVVFAAVWYFTYGLFFWWWLPSEVEFCILMTLPLVLAVLGALAWARRAGGWSARVATVLSVGLALLSVAGFRYHLQTVVSPLHDDRGAHFVAAERLFQASDGRCLVLARHRVFTAFRFYFDESPKRSFEVTQAFRLVDGGGEGIRRIGRHRAECVVLEGRELLPNRWFQGVTAYRAPERWLGFVRWLFEVAPCGEPGDALCARSFRWSAGPGRPPTLRIGGGIQRFEDLGAFFGRLAESAEGHHRRLARDLRRWIAAHPGIIDGRKVPPDDGGPEETVPEGGAKKR